MKKRLNQLAGLSLYEWSLLISSAILLPCTGISLQVFGYKRTKNILGSFIPQNSQLARAVKPDIKKARIIAHMVKITACYGFYRANCLKQSLVLWWLLASAGIPSGIKIGIQNQPGDSFGAHAWVECAGINLTDTESLQQQYTVFPNPEFSESGITGNISSKA